MADNSTKIVISAEDKASVVLKRVGLELGNFGQAVAGMASATGALSALTGAGVLAGLTAVGKSAIDFGGKLNDMAMQTGATVEQLSALRNAAELGGVSLDEAGRGLQKLSKYMLEAATGNKDAVATFKALGVSIADSNGALRDSGQVMSEVAKAIDGLASPTERVAAAQLLFGKTGAQLVPMLSDLAKQGEMVATWTEKDAALADEFGDNLAKLGQRARESGESIVRNLLPALVEASSRLEQAFRGGIVEGFTSRWAAAFKGLAAGINESAAAAEEFLGKITFGKVSERHYQEAMRFREAAKSIYVELAKLEAPAAAASAKRDSNGSFAKTLKDIDENSKKAKTSVDDLATVLNKINSKEAGLDASYWKDLEILHKGMESGRLTLEQYGTAVTKLSGQQKAHQDALKDVIEAAKAHNAAVTEALDEEEKQRKATEDAIRGIRERVEAVEQENKVMLMANDERERTIALLELDAKKAKLTAEAYEQMKARIQEAFSVRAARQLVLHEQEAQADLWKSIDRTAHDTFVSIFDSGKDAFERLRDTLKNTLYDLLYQMTIKKWLIQIVAGVSGTGVATQAFGQAAVNSAMSGGSVISGVGDLASMFNGGGAAGNYIGQGLIGLSNATGWQGVGDYGANLVSGSATLPIGGAFTAYSMGQKYGPVGGFAAGVGSTALAGGVTGMVSGAGFMSGASGALAGLGPWGWAALAVMALLGGMGQGGGPKFEGGAIRELLGTGGLSDFSTGNYYGDGRANNLGYGANAAMSDMVGNTLTNIGALVSSLGGNAAGIRLGLKFNTDPEGDAPDMVASDVWDAAGNLVYSFANNNVERGKYQEALAAEVKRATLGAIDAANIQPIFDAIIHGIDLTQASAAQLDAALTQINDVTKILGYGKSDPFADFAAAVENAGGTLFSAWERQGDGLRDLIAAYDGSAAATATLAQATGARYQTELQLAAQLKEVLSGTTAMFSDSRRSLRLDVLDSQGKYNFLQQENQGLAAQLATALDPTQIQSLSQRLNANVMQMWGLLPDGQQQGALNGMLAVLDQYEALAAQRVQASQEYIQADRANQAAAIQQQMDAAAALMAAAQRLNTVSPPPVTITINNPAGAEVALGDG